MKNYIDVKVTVWNRLHFAPEANMKDIANLIKEEDLDEAIDDKLGFIQSETIFDSTESLQPAQNNGEATIEVYEDDTEVWNNKIK